MDDEHLLDGYRRIQHRRRVLRQSIDLSAEKEPDIFNAIGSEPSWKMWFINKKHGWLIITTLPSPRTPRRPVPFITSITYRSCVAGPTISFLTCDAFGVLPPVKQTVARTNQFTSSWVYGKGIRNKMGVTRRSHFFPPASVRHS